MMSPSSSTSEAQRKRHRFVFSLISLFVVTAVVAMLICCGLFAYDRWQKQEIATAVPSEWSVETFDPHLKRLALACPSVKEISTDHRANLFLMVSQRCDVEKAREELLPYLSNPQLLETAQMMDMPLTEVLALSEGVFE